MTKGRSIQAEELRVRLAYAVERLRRAANRLEAVDMGLLLLRRGLEQRARNLALEAADRPDARSKGAIWNAQAQATAHLAQRAGLGHVLGPTSCLSLIGAMATTRWVGALRALSPSPRGEAPIKAHVEAGRLAYVALRSIRRSVPAGAGQLASAVVVAEFAHAEDRSIVLDQIDEGFDRARSFGSGDAGISAAATALCEAASVLDRVAEEAEVALERLSGEAESVEDRVEEALSRASEPRWLRILKS